MRRIGSIPVIVMLGLGLSLQTAQRASPTPGARGDARPNILFILTDDQRWDALAHLTRPDGVEVTPMPNVEHLIADQGMTLTNYFLSIGLCCPSRTSILRGQYAQHTRVYAISGPYGGWDTFLRKGDARSTIATALHAAGYETGLVGKFLNGYDAEDASIVPPGWDTWDALTKVTYYRFTESIGGVETKFPPSRYLTDELGSQALDFIERATGGGHPFFLYWAPKAPHQPATPAPQDVGTYRWMLRQHALWRPPSYDEPDVSDKPAVVRANPMPTDLKAKTDRFRERQYESLEDVDRWIATLIAAIDDAGQLSNTLIIFTSDNGMMWGEHRLAMMKNVGYEEAIRGPFVARWDGVIPPNSSDGHLAVNVDLAPTFAAAAGATIPYAVDGIDLMPILRGSDPALKRHAFLLEHGGARAFAPPFAGIRTDASFDTRIHHPFAYWWFFRTGDEELYDLNLDRFERNNLLRPGGWASLTPAQRAVVAHLRDWVRTHAVPLPPVGPRGPEPMGVVFDEDA